MARALTPEYHRVLGILAGCPDGATAYCLTHLNGVALRTIADLVQFELADAQQQTVAARNGKGEPITIVRLRITAAGRGAIQGPK